MTPRILVTGIPSQYTRLIQHAQGVNVVYSEVARQPQGKEAFIKELRDISNTGNYLIGEGALQALGGNAVHIPFWHLYNCCKNGVGLKEFAARFDVCVFTCANLLRPGLSADAEALVLGQLELPVVMLGIGIQSRANLKERLPAGTRDLLRVLRGREHHFLTRGWDAAEFLKEEGFSNVRPVGCPSIYFNAANVEAALRRLPTVKVGTAKTVFTGYLGAANLDSIVDMNSLTAPDGTAYYVAQDEHLHSGLGLEPDGNGRVYDPATGEIIGKSTFKGMETLQRRMRLYAFFDPIQWRAWISNMDFAFGRRFHGSVIALQAGVPALMVSVDDRMREMATFIGLPHMDPETLAKAENHAECVADHIASLAVGKVAEQYCERERNFRAALVEIGLLPAAEPRKALAS